METSVEVAVLSEGLTGAGRSASKMAHSHDYEPRNLLIFPQWLLTGNLGFAMWVTGLLECH